MLEVTLKNDSLFFGQFGLNFQRTLRIPDDGRAYKLPPGLGAFPLLWVQDYADRVPASWRETGGVFFPMYQREAMWISFMPRFWQPNCVKVGIGRINAVSGRPWDPKLSRQERDYLVSPPQPWLDGINAGQDTIRQFVAVPLGRGYTVEAQISGQERYGGIQIVVYEAKPGAIPERHRNIDHKGMAGFVRESRSSNNVEMGLAAGGQMTQKIYPDPFGLEVWDPDNYGLIHVHIVNSERYTEITGRKPPETPVNARTYTKLGLPWFDLYDEEMDSLPAPDSLAKVQTVSSLDAGRGLPAEEAEQPLDISEHQLIHYELEENHERSIGGKDDEAGTRKSKNER